MEETAERGSKVPKVTVRAEHNPVAVAVEPIELPAIPVPGAAAVTDRHDISGRLIVKTI
jgi:hypothetical protein